jgi:hypothetical protein
MSIENLDVNDYADSFEDDDELITTDSDDGVVTSLTDTSTTEEEVVVKEVVTTEKVVKEPKVHVKTKADYAREIFARLHGQEGIARKDVILALQDDANFGDLGKLTKAGAGTYYQNFTKKLVVTEVLPV